MKCRTLLIGLFFSISLAEICEYIFPTKPFCVITDDNGNTVMIPGPVHCAEIFCHVSRVAQNISVPQKLLTPSKKISVTDRNELIPPKMIEIEKMSIANNTRTRKYFSCETFCLALQKRVSENKKLKVVADRIWKRFEFFRNKRIRARQRDEKMKLYSSQKTNEKLKEGLEAKLQRKKVFFTAKAASDYTYNFFVFVN